MKRLVSFAIVAVLCAIGASGCSSQPAETSQAESVSSAGRGEDASQDHGPLQDDSDVEITVPAFIAGENASGELSDRDRQNGFKSARVNPDDSVTYTLGKSDHAAYVNQLYEGMVSAVEMLTDGQAYQSVRKVEHDDHFRTITITVDKGVYEDSFDALGIFSVGLLSCTYQVFAENEQEVRAEIQLKDEATGEIFQTTAYPDSLVS